jgi:O-antigen/teichoic acid export membrane protein
MDEPGEYRMNWLQKIWHNWSEDRVLGNVIKNSGYLFSSNTLGMAFTAVQAFLTPLLLGPTFLGALGMITTYASSINRLLSFRMTEVVIKNAGQEIARDHRQEAAAIIKVAGMTEALTSLVAYGVLAVFAPILANVIFRDPLIQASAISTQIMLSWILIYGLSVIASIVFETSTAILQLGNHFKSQAYLNLIQAAVVTAGIVFAFVTKGGIVTVLLAYLAGKIVLGFGTMILAWIWVKPLVGEGWWKTPLSFIPDKKKLGIFAINTNLSATLNTVFRDSEQLWVGLLVTTTFAGYFRFALTILNVVVLPISPFINTTFPQISRSIAQREWERLKNLLKRTSVIAAIWSGACLLGFALLGPIFFNWFKQGAFLPSYPVGLVLFIGITIPNILFWNRPLILCFGDSRYPLLVTLYTGIIKTGLMFLLVPTFGILVQAALLSAYGLSSALIIALKGLKEMRKAEAIPVQASAA